MSYLVLARKWRPQRFEEVVGQQPIIQTLQNAIRSKRVAHAFLFAGPRGVGKTSVARILAKALNCVNGPTPTPCNQCDACIEITKTIAPDVFEIDGASNTGVDHVRDLQETIKYLPQKYRYKVYIVDEVHMLSTPAFNAFLKTLEEPPAHVIFIFATTEPHKIIETVIDRCQRYDFKKIPSLLIFEKLQALAKDEEITISPNALQLISREADGSLRDAQSLLDQVITYAGKTVTDEHVADILGIVDTKVLGEISNAVFTQDLKKCLEIIEHVFTYGIDVRQFYRGLLEHFRNLMVAKISTNPQLFPDLSPKEIEELTNPIRKVSLEKLQLILKSLIESEGYIYRAPLPQVILEAIILRLATIPPVASLKGILERLGKLQEKLGNSSGLLAQTPPLTSPVSASETQKQTFSQTSTEETAPSSSSDPDDNARGCDMSLEKNWKEFLTFIRTKKPPLASFLEHGALVRLAPGSIEIGFPKNSFFLERIQEQTKKQELIQISEEFFGENKKVTIHALTTPSEEKKHVHLPLAQKNEKIRKEAKNNPLVKEALTIFEGSIIEIKVT
ncbi:MAG TPA: DNA polymerase III subunit gamma/tau [Thermodesulfobacteriota bacterium]|nr:DNA polymerase III subunit gamma/tau [Thermodesulfobacteriota bacterium]